MSISIAKARLPSLARRVQAVRGLYGHHDGFGRSVQRWCAAARWATFVSSDSSHFQLAGISSITLGLPDGSGGGISGA